LDWSRGRQLALRGLTKTLQHISGVGEQGAADLLHRLGNPLPWLLPRRPWTRHLPIGWFGCHLPQHCPVGAIEAAVCDLFPVAAGGIIHGVMKPPVARP
jgi:hypothetical protein